MWSNWVLSRDLCYHLFDMHWRGSKVRSTVKIIKQEMIPDGDGRHGYWDFMPGGQKRTLWGPLAEPWRMRSRSWPREDLYRDAPKEPRCKVLWLGSAQCSGGIWDQRRRSAVREKENRQWGDWQEQAKMWPHTSCAKEFKLHSDDTGSHGKSGARDLIRFMFFKKHQPASHMDSI